MQSILRPLGRPYYGILAKILRAKARRYLFRNRAVNRKSPFRVPASYGSDGTDCCPAADLMACCFLVRFSRMLESVPAYEILVCVESVNSIHFCFLFLVLCKSWGNRKCSLFAKMCVL